MTMVTQQTYQDDTRKMARESVYAMLGKAKHARNLEMEVLEAMKWSPWARNTEHMLLMLRTSDNRDRIYVDAPLTAARCKSLDELWEHAAWHCLRADILRRAKVMLEEDA